MEESILISIKKFLGLSKDYTAFDTDVIMHINSVFSTLYELGIGPEDGFMINDDSPVWNEFIGDRKDLNDVQTYIYLKVKLIFDPPQNSSVLQANKETIKELEWRLSVKAESE